MYMYSAVASYSYVRSIYYTCTCRVQDFAAWLGVACTLRLFNLSKHQMSDREPRNEAPLVPAPMRLGTPAER